MFAFEFLKDSNSLFQLPTFKQTTQQQVSELSVLVSNPCWFVLTQGACFLDKTECEVKKVQIACGLRLCKTSVEPFIIKVPRVKVTITQCPSVRNCRL